MSFFRKLAEAADAAQDALGAIKSITRDDVEDAIEVASAQIAHAGADFVSRKTSEAIKTSLKVNLGEQLASKKAKTKALVKK